MTTETNPIKLSKRQKQILAMLEKGMSNEQMSNEMGITAHTCKVHLWRLYQRLGVSNRGQAVKWWHDNQPTGMLHALRAAFDAACRLADQLKVDGGEVDPSEFEYHRSQVEQFQGMKA
jgi:DNA-binding CsgD family transcriptional regulator